MLKVSVKDYGEGIRQKVMKNLFQHEGFIKSRIKQESGIGLGLYICRKILRALGGEIMCESVWGIGSTFTFVVQLQSPDTIVDQVSRTLNPVMRWNFDRVNL